MQKPENLAQFKLETERNIIEQQYQKIIQETRLCCESLFTRQGPLLTHGTMLRKFNRIWMSGIRPPGDITSNWGPGITKYGYVSLDRVEASFFSVHGEISLVIDENLLEGKITIRSEKKFDPDTKTEYESFRHETYKGTIPTKAIVGVYCNFFIDRKADPKKFAELIYRRMEQLGHLVPIFRGNPIIGADEQFELL